jgi:uncharacterized protein (TIGR03437 family)
VAYRYPPFLDLAAVGDTANYAVSAAAPVALTQDPFGNLLAADLLHRVSIYFPGVLIMNGANYLGRIAPGMVTTLQSRGLRYNFSAETKVFNELPNPLPLPTALGDLRVLIDDLPVPLYFISPDQINFLMPNSAPSSGTVELQVVQESTGRIVATRQVQMDVASPGFFTVGSTGTGQIAALNQNGTVNTAGNRARRGEVIQLFGTGAGRIPNAPPDGAPAEGLTPTGGELVVIVNGRPIQAQYSGLAPGLVGVWQINFTIPDTVPPSDAIQVVVLMNNIPSNNPQNPNQIRTTIAVQ